MRNKPSLREKIVAYPELIKLCNAQKEYIEFLSRCCQIKQEDTDLGDKLRNDIKSIKL